MATKKKAEPTTAVEKANTPSKSSLYGQAVRVLRERHWQEFDEIITEIYAEHGHKYTRRLTAEERAAKEEAEAKERAEAQLQRLIERHPVLRNRIVDEPAQ